MKAKLVTYSFTVRVVVEDTATEQDIINASFRSLEQRVHESYGENVDTIEDDTEMPYSEEYDG